MKGVWPKVFSAFIASACALVIIAYMPAILTDNLVTAVGQIRQNATKTVVSPQPTAEEETSPGQQVTPALKKLTKLLGLL